MTITVQLINVHETIEFASTVLRSYKTHSLLISKLYNQFTNLKLQI